MPEKKSRLPNRIALQHAYDSYYIDLAALVNEIERFLRGKISMNPVPTYKSRVKTFASYYSKLLRLSDKFDMMADFPVTTDLIGIRVVCPFLNDLPLVEERLKALFQIREIEHKGINRSFSEFGYESIHVLVEIPGAFLLDKTVPAALCCEIQIRTILQDAWAEVEHELVYKSEFNPFDLPLKRKLAAINANLSLADMIFQEIRSYQKNFRDEIAKRREIFYDKADDLMYQSSREVFDVRQTGAALNPLSENQSLDTIDDMLLRALHAQNACQFVEAIEIYSQIIERSQKNPIVLAVIYNHRGMAYFAQNDFEKARADFHLAAASNPKNLRSWYYCGIVATIGGKNSEAIDYFSKSLELNPYQARVYFRRGVSFYHLGEYEKAMEDLTKAKDLGFSIDEVQKLNLALLKKLDIC